MENKIKEKKKYSSKNEVGICRVCGKNYDDYEQKHRRHICKECWNIKNYETQKKSASTIDGYLKVLLRSIRNEKTRNRHGVDIDLEHLLKLWELQDGKCAISNVFDMSREILQNESRIKEVLELVHI